MQPDRSDFNSDIAPNSALNIWTKISTAPRAIWQKRHRLFAIGFNTGVVAFAVGIGAYFSMPFEPRFMVGLSVALICAVLALWQRARAGGVGSLLSLCLICALGWVSAQYHTQAAGSPKLPNYERSYRLSGWVSAIERSGKGERYRIEVAAIDGLSSERTPKRLRIRVTKAAETAILAGDSVRWHVAAKAPPGPVVPNGYDPARAAYFNQIGGFGFGYGAPEKLADLSVGTCGQIRRSVTRWRYGVALRVKAQAPAKTAGLQAALLTGVRRYIPPAQTEALRAAGLAHILAISGLHMGLLAGGTFTFVTLLLACIWPLSRRYDVRKPAAIVGIIAASLYLMLSGASVATQRAWVMAVILFLAVILDRRALSMRSVCVAALVTLCLHPESLISVGFQMSFAAVAALVATYQAWQSYRADFSQKSLGWRAFGFFGSLSVTSLVAGFATAGFALFHFNRFARYGVIGNLLAMPIFTLAVMPLAVISLLLMPFGLERYPLGLMGRALEPILASASWVASWPNSVAHIGAPPDWVLGVYGLGFAALVMGRWPVRLGGGVLIMAAILGWRAAPQADLRISEQAQVAFWQPPAILPPDKGNKGGGGKAGKGVKAAHSEDDRSTPTLFVSSGRGDRYGREQFVQRAGQSEVEWARYMDGYASCDALACRAEIKGWVISILQNPSEVPEDCATSDLVILSVRQAGPVARRHCQAMLIDEKSLAQTGALDVYLGDAYLGDSYLEERPMDQDISGQTVKGEITVKAAKPLAKNRRPWSS